MTWPCVRPRHCKDNSSHKRGNPQFRGQCAHLVCNRIRDRYTVIAPLHIRATARTRQGNGTSFACGLCRGSQMGDVVLVLRGRHEFCNVDGHQKVTAIGWLIGMVQTIGATRKARACYGFVPNSAVLPPVGAIAAEAFDNTIPTIPACAASFAVKAAVPKLWECRIPTREIPQTFAISMARCIPRMPATCPNPCSASSRADSRQGSVRNTGDVI